MFDFSSYNFGTVDWLLLFICCGAVGMAKTGVPGIGITAVPVLASIMPAKESVGFLLPLLMTGDIFGIVYYRKYAVVKAVLKILPWTVLGIFSAYLVVGKINNQQLEPIIGAVVILMLGLGEYQKYRRDKIKDIVENENESAPKKVAIYWTAFLGIFAGITTMLANAAGPVAVIYMVMLSVNKRQFVGTIALYAFIGNWIKVPFFLGRDMITMQSLGLDILMLPGVALGAVIGYFVLSRIPQKFFDVLVVVLAGAAAIKLLWPNL
jgi:hypothetical protein